MRYPRIHVSIPPRSHDFKSKPLLLFNHSRTNYHPLSCITVMLCFNIKTHLNPKLILNFSIPPIKPTLTFHLVANNPITHVINRSEQVCVVKKNFTHHRVYGLFSSLFTQSDLHHRTPARSQNADACYVMFYSLNQPIHAQKKAKEKKSVIPCHERKKMICSGK